MPKLNPKIAGWWNVILCGGLNVFAVVQALLGQPVMLLLLIVAVPMEVFFVRALISAYRPADATIEPVEKASTPGVHPRA